MNIGSFLILGVGAVGVWLLLRNLVRQFRTGGLTARGGRVFSTRAANPMLYWSSMFLQSFVAIIVVGIFLFAVKTLLGWHTPWH